MLAFLKFVVLSIVIQQNTLDTIFLGNRIPSLKNKVDGLDLTNEILEQGGIHCLWGIPVAGIVDLIELRRELTAFLAEQL